jgi:hypothetical protein
LFTSVFVHVGVQIELARLDQLHDGRPGEQLRHGAGSEQRELRIHRRAGRDVRVAIALLQQHRAVLHDYDDCAGDIAGGQGVAHEAVDPGFDIRTIEHGCRGRGSVGGGPDLFGRGRRRQLRPAFSPGCERQP